MFHIENVGFKPVSLRFLIEISEEMKNFIAIEVMSQQSKVSYEKNFLLSPSESVDVLVQIWAKLDIRIPPNLLDSHQKLLFGKLIVLEPGAIVDSIMLWGSFTPVRFFCILFFTASLTLKQIGANLFTECHQITF